MKQALIFMSVYSQKIAKNPSKIFFLVPFQICKFSQNTSISGIAWSNYEEKKKNIQKSSHYGLSNDADIKYL